MGVLLWKGSILNSHPAILQPLSASDEPRSQTTLWYTSLVNLAMSFPNVYAHRKVAETAMRGCDVCFRPTSSVLLSQGADAKVPDAPYP